jgi:hypothetical protein
MLYANVSATQRSLQAMLAGMAGIAAMAAAIPQATATRATAFTLAYLATRVARMRSWTRSAQTLLLAGGPALRRAHALDRLPVVRPARAVLAVGLGMLVDPVPSVLVAGDPDRLLASMREPIQRQQEPQERRQCRSARAAGAPRTAVGGHLAQLDPSLLDERLRLFVIIVLGEAVAQVVSAAARADWTTGLLGAGLASFELLVGLWWLTFRYGSRRCRILGPASWRCGPPCRPTRSPP